VYPNPTGANDETLRICREVKLAVVMVMVNRRPLLAIIEVLAGVLGICTGDN
jgi:hypothetical protein